MVARRGGIHLFSLAPTRTRIPCLILLYCFFDERCGFRVGEIEKDTICIHGNVAPFFGRFVGCIYQEKVLVPFGVRNDPVALELARVESPAFLHLYLDERALLACFLLERFVPNGGLLEKAEEA